MAVTRLVHRISVTRCWANPSCMGSSSRLALPSTSIHTAPRSLHTSSYQAARRRPGSKLRSGVAPTPTPEVCDAQVASGELPSQTAKTTAEPELNQVQRAAIKAFGNVYLDKWLATELAVNFPFIQVPTDTQTMLLRAIRKPSDIILRSQTSSGKSFAALLAMLNQHPDLMDQPQTAQKVSRKQKETKKKSSLASIIVVPTRELARQYMEWSQELVPKSMQKHMANVIQVRYKTKECPLEKHIDTLCRTPPRVLVITATLFCDIMQDKRAQEAFNMAGLNTLVMDEIDALLDLPGRFPTQKVIWKHEKHPPAGLRVLEWVMKHRKGFSTGSVKPSSGLEPHRSKVGKLKEPVRRTAHMGAELTCAKYATAAEKSQASKRPLQLVMMSATANAVLRHFLGARTGWLRTGLRNEETGEETGKWIDMTGLSLGLKKADEMDNMRIQRHGVTGVPRVIPKEIRHHCIVVDDAFPGRGKAADGLIDDADWRNMRVLVGSAENAQGTSMDDKAAKNAKPQRDYNIQARPARRTTDVEGLDTPLLKCLAYLFATQGVQRGMAVVPDSYSTARTKIYLEGLGIPVQRLFVTEDEAIQPEGEEKGQDSVLYLGNASSIRGLDIAGGISHVFLVGGETVDDATAYTHLAGRVSRLGKHWQGEVEDVRTTAEKAITATSDAGQDATSTTPVTDEKQTIVPPPLHSRPPGTVVTLLRGLDPNSPMPTPSRGPYAPPPSAITKVYSADEMKMSAVVNRLSIRLLPLSLKAGQVDEEQESD